MKHNPLSLLIVCAAIATATSASAIRPLGPHPVGKQKAKAARGSTQDLLRQAQLRIAPYQKAAVATPASSTPAMGLPASQINIPNLPGNAPGPAPATLGRAYTQEEVTRSWAPYTYP